MCVCVCDYIKNISFSMFSLAKFNWNSSKFCKAYTRAYFTFYESSARILANCMCLLFICIDVSLQHRDGHRSAIYNSCYVNIFGLFGKQRNQADKTKTNISSSWLDMALNFINCPPYCLKGAKASLDYKPIFLISIRGVINCPLFDR